jgi:long-chain fatty acid transport protein
MNHLAASRIGGHARTFFASGLAIVSLSASAGGLGAYEVGTADVGLASAGYSARAQDPSTVLTNPAGMTLLSGTQILGGAQVLYGDMKFSPGTGTSPGLGTNDGGNPVGWFPGGGLFITHSLSNDLKVGFAATGNFGLAESFDNGWVGRYRIQDATLIAISLLPSIAYRATEKLSLGASLNATYGLFKSKMAVNNAGDSRPDGKLEMDDGTWGWGVNLGALYEFSKATRVGLTYNSQVKLDFSPQANFSGQGPILNNLLVARGLLNANVNMGMTIPQAVNASFFHQIDDRWAALGSLGWQQWSRFGKIQAGIDSNDPKNISVDMDLKDTWHAALGGQYRISQPWLLNFGVAYDSAFQKSDKILLSMPSNAAWRFGLGVQNQASKDFEWGVAAEYVYGGTLDYSASGANTAIGGRGDLVGTYKPRVVYLSANAIWKF